MILLYHKVFPESKSYWWVDVDTFYRQMLELKGKEVVYLDDLDPLNENQAAITFDGIYRNVLQYAAPILHDLGYPFELFVTSDYIGKDNAFDTGEPLAEFATTQELERLVSMGGRLQWHTRSHRNLAEIKDQAELIRELEVPDSLRPLDPKGFRWFAYPYGDVTETIAREVSRRFAGALSCHQGDDNDRHRLNRVIAEPNGRFATKSISLIIPSYNYGRYLADAVESALRQTRPPDEILIIDDASSDDTDTIGKNYARLYPNRIRFHRNEKNLGIIGTFNLAVSMTKGDYICFLGADNRFRSDYVEKTAQVLDENPKVGVAYTDFVFFGQRAKLRYEEHALEVRGRQYGETGYAIVFPEPSPENAVAEMEKGNFIHGSSLYRRTAFEKAGGYVQKATQPEDYNLFSRMLGAGFQAKHCAAPLLEYRQHSAEQANTSLASFEQVLFYRKNALDFEKKLNVALPQIQVLEKQFSDAQTQADHLLIRLDEMCALPWHRLLIHAAKRDIRKLKDRFGMAARQLRGVGNG